MRLTEALIEEYGKPVELVVVGKVSSALRERWQRRAGFPVHFSGQLPREQIPNMDRSAHVLYSADIHAACPNSVIEALACGLPVVGFDTGALSELVTGDSGRITPYGGNAWRLDPPDIPFLARATVEILEHQDRFRHAARARAEEAFGLDKMVASYLDSLLSG
jgi:glycosyltransferase involved in cell wall biosynthesis